MWDYTMGHRAGRVSFSISMKKLPILAVWIPNTAILFGIGGPERWFGLIIYKHKILFDVL